MGGGVLCATLSHGHIQCVGIARIKTIAYFCALQSFDSQNVYGQTFWQRFSQSSAICRQLDKAKVFNQLAYVYVACMCMCLCVCVFERGCSGICNYCRLAQNSLHVCAPAMKVATWQNYCQEFLDQLTLTHTLTHTDKRAVTHKHNK